MRLERAIEKFLAHGEMEHDWTPSTLRSYALLYKLVDDNPGADVKILDDRPGHDVWMRWLARWARAAPGTRANRISIAHSFGSWLESEWLIENDPSRRIKRPPKRKAKTDRPTPSELDLIVREASIVEYERAPIVAMRGAGFRRSTVLASRWRDWNLTNGTVKAYVKGGHWLDLPIEPMTLELMRDCYRVLEPDPLDYLFPKQLVRLVGPSRNVRTVPDTTLPSSPQALWNMLHRVSKRAIGRELHPHQLRHGFATALDREGLDLRTLQLMMGHSRVETTETYLDERRLEEAAQRLDELHERRLARQQRLATPSSSLETPLKRVAGIEPASPADSLSKPYLSEPAASEATETEPNGGHNVDDDT